MKVPSAPIGVSAAVADDEKLKEGVYEFLKFYYGEEAAKLSYEGSIFPATNYDSVSAADTQFAMNAMLESLASGWEVRHQHQTLQFLQQYRKHCMMRSSEYFREHMNQKKH